MQEDIGLWYINQKLTRETGKGLLEYMGNTDISISMLSDLEHLIQQDKQRYLKSVDAPSPTTKYMIGQRVILTGQGGVKEIGKIVASENGLPPRFGAWVFSPSKNFASDYALHSIQPLPDGQL